jgi:hypothetical protein
MARPWALPGLCWLALDAAMVPLGVVMKAMHQSQAGGAAAPSAQPAAYSTIEQLRLPQEEEHGSDELELGSDEMEDEDEDEDAGSEGAQLRGSRHSSGAAACMTLHHAESAGPSLTKAGGGRSRGRSRNRRCPSPYAPPRPASPAGAEDAGGGAGAPQQPKAGAGGEDSSEEADHDVATSEEEEEEQEVAVPEAGAAAAAAAAAAEAAAAQDGPAAGEDHWAAHFGAELSDGRVAELQAGGGGWADAGDEAAAAAAGAAGKQKKKGRKGAAQGGDALWEGGRWQVRARGAMCQLPPRWLAAAAGLLLQCQTLLLLPPDAAAAWLLPTALTALAHVRAVAQVSGCSGLPAAPGQLAEYGVKERLRARWLEAQQAQQQAQGEGQQAQDAERRASGAGASSSGGRAACAPGRRCHPGCLGYCGGGSLGPSRPPGLAGAALARRPAPEPHLSRPAPPAPAPRPPAAGDFASAQQRQLFAALNSYRDVWLPARPYATDADAPGAGVAGALPPCLPAPLGARTL